MDLTVLLVPILNISLLRWLKQKRRKPIRWVVRLLVTTLVVFIFHFSCETVIARKCYRNRPCAFSHGWTGTSIQLRLVRGISFEFEKIPRRYVLMPFF